MEQQPPAGTEYPPQDQPRWPDDGIPATGGRPANVAAAAIVLIVLGVLAGLLGVLLLIIGAMFGTIVTMPEFSDQLGDVSPAAGGVFVVMGFVFLGFGVGQVVSGIFILPGKAWARITGLIVAILGTLLALVGVLPGETGGANIVFLVVLIAYVYSAWVLISHGRWFRP